MNNITRIVDYLKAHGDNTPEPVFVCAACEDTGWVEVDDGLVEGRRVRAPQVARCTSLLHQRKPVVVAPTPERFS